MEFTSTGKDRNRDAQTSRADSSRHRHIPGSARLVEYSLSRILEHRKGQGVVWALGRAEFANQFGQILLLDHGKLVEHGAFEDLKGSGSALHRLLNPA